MIKSMINLIAETAWHHQGDFKFMRTLVDDICETNVDIVKMHISLDLEEYMSIDHEAFQTLKNWMFDESQWHELISFVQSKGKKIMLLLNDSKAIEFAAQYNPDFVEIHSVCLNVPRIQDSIKKYISPDSKIVIGVGGSSIEEINFAVNQLKASKLILMFGFQNYPTKYEDINLKKIQLIQKMFTKLEFGYADHTSWDNDNNELITLMVASNNMTYVEKHVTNVLGEERCDFSAAISIEQFQSLSQKVKLLSDLLGNGDLELNSAEKLYSVYGPMKMAARAISDIESGSNFEIGSVDFIRMPKISTMSQIDVLSSVGRKVVKSLKKGDVVNWENFE